MSFIYYDGTIIPRMSLNRATQVYKRFDKFWGGPESNRTTLTFDGVEVYKEKMTFYTNGFRTDLVTKKFVKTLGMKWDEFLSQDIDSEIETMYFQLKPGFKYSGERAYLPDIEPEDFYSGPTKEMIADKFTTQLSVGDTVNVTVSYGGALKRYIGEHDLGWIATGNEIQTTPLNTDEIRTTLASNPWYYYANSRHIDYTSNSLQFQLYDGSDSGASSAGGWATPKSTPVCDTATTNNSMGVLALLDNGSVFEPVLNADGTVKVSNEITSTVSVLRGGEVTRYQYNLSFIYKGATASSTLVGQIYNWYTYYYDDILEIPKGDVDSKITSQIDTKIKHELYNMRYDTSVSFEAPETVETSLYLKVPSYVNNFDDNPPELVYTDYLKVNGVKHMKKREFVKFLSKSIDTGYTAEDQEWWEKVLAVVIIIVAIIVTVLVCIYATVACGATAEGLATLSLALGAGAMTLTLGSMVLAKVGGLSSQGLVKQLGTFAAVVGIVATVTGIYAAIQNYAQNTVAEMLKQMGKEAGSQAVATQLAEMSLGELVSEAISQALTGAVDMATEAMTAMTNATVSELGNSAITVAKYLMKAYEFVQDQEKAKLDQEIAAAKSELELLEEEAPVGYTFEPGVFMMHHELLSSPDKLQELAMEIDSRIGRDAKYNSWDAHVNRS